MARLDQQTAGAAPELASADAAQRECVRIFPLNGNMALVEIRPDGTHGRFYLVPDHEYTTEEGALFTAYIQRLHQTPAHAPFRRMSLVP